MHRLYFDSQLSVERRDDAPPKISGYAARFNVKSEDLGGFREIIAPGAFADSIKRGEVVALWNHNPEKPFARTGNGSLSLEEDEKGLRMEATPDGTSWGRDALESVSAGTVYRTSFGFTIKDRNKDQEWSEDGKTRTLLRVGVFDVSPVTFPAYKQTRISVRASRLSDLMESLESGEELREAELRFLRESVADLQRTLEPSEQESRSEEEREGLDGVDVLPSLLRDARLRLAELD